MGEAVLLNLGQRQRGFELALDGVAVDTGAGRRYNLAWHVTDPREQGVCYKAELPAPNMLACSPHATDSTPNRQAEKQKIIEDRGRLPAGGIFLPVVPQGDSFQEAQ